MRKALILSLIVFVVTTGMVFGRGQVEYPSRDITNVVVWAAGGGTDLANRLVMAEMAKIMNVNINVVNVTGGVGGSVGMLEAFNRPADGYTIAGISESIVTAGVQGGWDRRASVWEYFIIGGSPGVLSVTPTAPYRNIKELVEAARANPRGIRAGASASGSFHHLNLLAFERGTGAQFNFIPYPGSAPTISAAMTGEISVVVTTVQEQSEMIRAGRLRPLAMLIPESFKVGDITIPSAFTEYPVLSRHLPLVQQIGFAIRRDAPEPIKARLREAFKQAVKAEPVQQFGRDRFFTIQGIYGDEANKIFDRLESVFAWTLWDLGAGKVDPATLGIPRP